MQKEKYADWLDDGNVRRRARREMAVFFAVAFALWLSGFLCRAYFYK